MRYRPAPRIERLEQRCMLSATVFENNDVGYFLDAGDRSLERYDIVNQQWLTPIALAQASGAPTVAHVDDDGIYVGYGAAIYRYQLNGSSPVHLLNAPNAVTAIHSDGGVLFLNHTAGLYARFISVSKSTNTIIDTFENYVDSVQGSSIAPGVNRIFGRSTGVSPSDITYVAYSDAGEFTNGGDSPAHGDYPGASRTWVFPDSGKVVDDSGTIYSTNSLIRLNSFGTTIKDVDFSGSNIPIVLGNSVITAYTAGILPAGSKALASAATDIFVNASNVLAFTPNASNSHGYTVEIVPLVSLNAPTPGQPVDPVGLTYTPDEIALSSDGKLLLYSKSHQSIFRWDPVTQGYDASFPLIGSADYMAYSPATNTAYLAYGTGLIRKLDLNAANPAEAPFATLPSGPLGLATAGQYLFAVDESGAWVSHYTFHPDGTQVSAVDWNYYSSEYIWSESNQKMYFFRDDTSPNDLLSEEIDADGTGAIGAKIDSPLHSSGGFSHPIRVSPDGSVVVLGSGAIHNGTTLARLSTALPFAVSDMAWAGGSLFTMRVVGGVTQFQKWTGATYAAGAIKQVSQGSVALVAVGGDKLVGITSSGGSGGLTFTLMDQDLNVIPRPAPVANAGPDAQSLVGDSVTLNGANSHDPDNTPQPLTYLWSLVSGPGAATFGTPDAPVTTFTGSAAGDYVVALTVNDGAYSTSDTVKIRVRTNQAPVADPSLSSVTAIAGRTFATLNGSRSADADGDPLTYLWSITARPAGSTAAIGFPNMQSTTFGPDVPGVYTIELQVNDGFVNDAESFTITVGENRAPVADASKSLPTAVANRSPAVLDAGRSTDPDGDQLTYQWRVLAKPVGGEASITWPQQSVTNFNATLPGLYSVELVVSDGLLTDSDVLFITVGANQAPIADASASDTSVVAGSYSATLDGRRSSDPDRDPISYWWRVVASTNGTLPSIGYPYQSVAQLSSYTPGVYAIELTVSDGLATDTDYVIVTVRGNQPPQADASLSQTIVTHGALARLDGSRSADPDGDPLAYQWNVVAASSGVIPALANGDQSVAFITAQDVGHYVVELQVTDGVATSSEFLIVTVRPGAPAAGAADFDTDGDADGSDFLAWQRGLGCEPTVAARSQGDADADLDVDAADLSVWMGAFGATTAPLASDFDGDGYVSGSDLLAWQLGLGTALPATKAQGDADGDNLVTGADLLLWRDAFGAGSDASSTGLTVATASAADLTGYYDAAMVLAISDPLGKSTKRIAVENPAPTLGPVDLAMDRVAEDGAWGSPVEARFDLLEDESTCLSLEEEINVDLVDEAFETAFA